MKLFTLLAAACMQPSTRMLFVNPQQAIQSKRMFSQHVISKNWKGFTPLHHACITNDIARAKELLRDGVPVNKRIMSLPRIMSGGTLLAMPIAITLPLLMYSMQNPEALGWILPDLTVSIPAVVKGLDLVTCSKNTALHIAVKEENSKLVALLLSYGADPLIENADQQTAHDLVSQVNYQNKEIQQMIQHAVKYTK